MRKPGIEEKVAYLGKTEAYPERPDCVETVQTHMSWVFLTGTLAWKLKKPVRTEFVDFTTPEKRRLDCEEEVRLNRRLAPDVYRCVVALTVDRNGKLQLGGAEEPVDWLLCMRQLPRDRMLDQMIARHAVSEEDVLRLVSRLTSIYKTAPPIRITRLQYRTRLAAQHDAVRRALKKPKYELSRNLVDSVINSQLAFLEHESALFDARVRAGKIIECHGDLRPEHVCLERQPVVIDCLEFNRNLRILDVASELTFLALECERLGAPDIGELIFRKYNDDTGDQPPDRLLQFYRGYHACIRARIAVSHLDDDRLQDPWIWIEKANRYLHLVAGVAGPVHRRFNGRLRMQVR